MGGLEADPPELCELSAQAHHAWNFCGGWAPLALPLYAALYGVHDWHALIDTLHSLRSEMSAAPAHASHPQ